MKPILDFFSSVNLNLALLLGLSIVEVFARLWPGEQDKILRFEEYFQPLCFRLLPGLLALNLSNASGCAAGFFVRFSAVGVVPTAESFRLLSLAGFRGEVGREQLQALATRLGWSSPHV